MSVTVGDVSIAYRKLKRKFRYMTDSYMVAKGALKIIAAGDCEGGRCANPDQVDDDLPASCWPCYATRILNSVETMEND